MILRGRPRLSRPRHCLPQTYEAHTRPSSRTQTALASRGVSWGPKSPQGHSRAIPSSPPLAQQPKRPRPPPLVLPSHVTLPSLAAARMMDALPGRTCWGTGTAQLLITSFSSRGWGLGASTAPLSIHRGQGWHPELEPGLNGSGVMGCWALAWGLGWSGGCRFRKADEGKESTLSVTWEAAMGL